MNASLIEIIADAIAAARQAGLSLDEEHDTARAVLLARDSSLTPGIARILVDQLYMIGSANADARMAA